MARHFILLVSLSALMLACGNVSNLSQQSESLRLSAVKANGEMIPNRMEFVGQTQALRSYIIQPRVNGYLKSINFRSGMPVHRGQLLFTLDAAPFEAVTAQQRANLASARAALTQAQSDYNRSVPLAQISAISQSQLDAATATLESAKESVEAAKAVLRGAQLNLGYTTITAPESGIVAQSAANVGDYVGAETQYQVLTTIAYNDSIVVNLSLPTAKYYAILCSNTASFANDSLLSDIELRLSDGTLYPQRGVYKYTKQNVDNQSGAIIMQVAFPNKAGLLKAGQFARVSTNVGALQNRVLIPQRAVNQTQGIYSVWVVNAKGEAEFREVTVGDTWGSMWIIENGLKAGETVLTEGFAKVRKGMKIEPQYAK